MEDKTMTANGTSVIKYDGTDYRLLLTVAAALNFTVQFLHSKSWDDVSACLHSPEQIEYVQGKMCGQTTGAGAVFQDMAAMLLGQSLPHRLSSHHSSRVLMAAWIVFALIVGVAYRGNLTASLTLPKFPPRPETLPQLVDTVESRAHLGGRRYLKYQIADKFTGMDGISRLYVGRETLYPGASGWPIPHDAPYKAQLDHWIMATIEVCIAFMPFELYLFRTLLVLTWLVKGI
ncbi:hypothetical protein E2C01_046026 [Portunus trituberculatus]|uniref:Ionotropic glutamate receptor C-terminal domain-containing protein n=1 Tax=Portunus trituberculatus TaxID=210409 RepID=A0A5B7G6H9_PORTR|nr:hypothetical protein [Portunus trituberculatus]